MKLLISFGVHYKSGQFLVVISIHFKAFPGGQGTDLESFWGLLTFNCFILVCPIFLIFLGGKQ